MAAQPIVLACSSTPQVVAGSFGSGNYHGYIRVRLKMIAGTGYLGDSGATTAGFPLTTGDGSLDVALNQGETLWAASSSGGTPTMAVLRVGETT